MILYTTLHRLIGLKLLMVEGLWDLGMKTISELFISLGMEPSTKKEVTA